MGDDARLTLRPRCLAIRAGSRGPARRDAERQGLRLRALARPRTLLAHLLGGEPLTARGQAPEGRYWAGSTGEEPLRISKCSCGDDTVPVWPDLAMTCPRRTASLRLTRISLACA